MVLAVMPAGAEDLRVATWDVDLNRRGPGLLLQDIERGRDPQVRAVVEVAAMLDADILVLTGFDYDHDGVALAALAARLKAAGTPYPYRFARRPNTGRATGLDLDGDGRMGGAGDAQGWGRFSGEGGMAVLSRLPFDEAGFRDYSAFLWRDLPGALLPPGMTEAAQGVQRLSTTAHWALPVILPDGGRLTLLAWQATPPVFDGPEDRNGRRNHDEAAFWLRLLAGDLPMPPPEPPFVLLGNANLDTERGNGRPYALEALMRSARLQDPAPRPGKEADADARRGGPVRDAAAEMGAAKSAKGRKRAGKPAAERTATEGTGTRETGAARVPTSGTRARARAHETATADFTARNGPGLLRVDYVLPSSDLHVTGAFVLWPSDDDPFAPTVALASRHRPVAVDIALP